MTVQSRVANDGSTVYFRTDADGNMHRLNAEEVKTYLGAKRYKQELLKKVGTGAAIATGMAGAEVAMGTAAGAAEVAVGVAEGIAIAPVVLTVAAIGGAAFLGWKAIEAWDNL